jgi:hypothetical protein
MKKVALIGVIIFIIPVALFVLWIYAFSKTSGYPENVNLYQSYLPSFLKGRLTTTLLSFVTCVIAVVLNARNLNAPNKSRIVSWFVVIAASLLALMNLFSMM